MKRLLLTALVLAGAASLSSAQQLVPLSPILTPEQAAAAPKPIAKPDTGPVYDEKADAQAQIAAALANAHKNNRRVLIQWGANWCGWCRLLHGTFTTDPEIKKKLLYEYDVVFIDVGRFDKNIVLARLAGADLKAHGLPYLTVLDGDGNIIANQDTGELEAKGEGAHGHDQAKVLGFLKDHQAAYPKSEDLLATGLAQAKKEHKKVFLHFGAPWCGWCHRLEDWMARPEVASIMSKDLVDLKIDQDRTLEAKAVFQKYCPKPGGIPWFCILDEDGKAIITSDGEKGNIGFPTDPDDINHFIGMMNKAKKSMTDADIAALRASLEADKKKSGGEG